MPDTTTAAIDFVAHAGLSDSDSPDLPDLLAMPLRRRLRLIEQGEITAQQWRDTADAWSAAADARYRACVDLRPLDPRGAPVAVGVKDTIDVAGLPTRLGLRRHRHHPRRSAAVLDRLRGVVVNAKVVTTELNIGIGSGCLNPYASHIDPAGSSTGSAVAVAAGISDLSLGTDVLGSVRWPSGRCGVVGLRVTHDPRLLPGVFPLSPAMDAPGWVARTADDLGLLWERFGLGAPESGPPAPPPYRIGVVGEVLDGDVEAEILGALSSTGRALSDAGHQVRQVRLGELWNWRGAAWELCARDAWDGYQVWREWITDDLSDSTLRALQAGHAVSDTRLAQIRAGMRAQRAAAGRRFADAGVHAWLLPLDPTVPRPRSAPVSSGSASPARVTSAFSAGGSAADPPRAQNAEVTRHVVTSTIPTPEDPDYEENVGYTPVASFAGLPAITFPVGRSPSTGAPLAMQLVGPRHSESTLIRIAADIAA
jgi:Asp-tRNA(Asn)/Glu-tRNA(Gln) amidotransferase A subunit family amidase